MSERIARGDMIGPHLQLSGLCDKTMNRDSDYSQSYSFIGWQLCFPLIQWPAVGDKYKSIIVSVAHTQHTTHIHIN